MKIKAISVAAVASFVCLSLASCVSESGTYHNGYRVYDGYDRYDRPSYRNRVYRDNDRHRHWRRDRGRDWGPDRHPARPGREYSRNPGDLDYSGSNWPGSGATQNDRVTIRR